MFQSIFLYYSNSFDSLNQKVRGEENQFYYNMTSEKTDLDEFLGIDHRKLSGLKTRTTGKPG